MYKIHKKYEDYNGNEREDDFCFNLTVTELADMETSEEGGLGERIKKLSSTNNMKEALKFFKSFVLLAYGKKTEDGRFVKNEKYTDEFISTAAFSDIFMSLAMNPDEANKFIKGVIPNDEKFQKYIDAANPYNAKSAQVPPLPNKHN